VLIQDKVHQGQNSPTLMFEIVPTDNGSFRIEWHGECGLTIEDLERKHKGSSTLEAAEHFLLEKLADGKKLVNWLVDQAKGLCSKRTLLTLRKPKSGTLYHGDAYRIT
jgi:hypothetical protein